MGGGGFFAMLKIVYIIWMKYIEYNLQLLIFCIESIATLFTTILYTVAIIICF
jgi:hypothetical protein